VQLVFGRMSRQKGVLNTRSGPSGSLRAAMSDWDNSWRDLNVAIVSSRRRAVNLIYFPDHSGPPRAFEPLRQPADRLFDHRRTCDDGRTVAFGRQCETSRARIAS
jgi:hypothetical protein